MRDERVQEYGKEADERVIVNERRRSGLMWGQRTGVSHFAKTKSRCALIVR